VPVGRAETPVGWSTIMQSRRTSVPAQEPESGREMTELPSTSSPITPPPVAAQPDCVPGPARRDTNDIQPAPNRRRSEWARQRAVAMLGRNRAPVDPDAEEEQRTPGWRKALGRIFPAAR
jgi:hypothetical protein